MQFTQYICDISNSYRSIFEQSELDPIRSNQQGEKEKSTALLFHDPTSVSCIFLQLISSWTVLIIVITKKTLYRILIFSVSPLLTIGYKSPKHLFGTSSLLTKWFPLRCSLSDKQSQGHTTEKTVQPAPRRKKKVNTWNRHLVKWEVLKVHYIFNPKARKLPEIKIKHFKKALSI